MVSREEQDGTCDALTLTVCTCRSATDLTRDLVGDGIVQDSHAPFCRPALVLLELLNLIWSVRGRVPAKEGS